jgi:hypothetical protein
LAGGAEEKIWISETDSSRWLQNNEELHNFYSSPTFIRVSKSRRMRRAEHAAHMGK